MSILNVSVDDAATEKTRLFIDSFKKQAMPAVCKSLNRAASGIKTDSAREARTVYNVKASSVKKAATVRKATFAKPAASVSYVGKYIPLIAFGPKPSRPNVYAKAGITVKVKATRKTVRGGFVTQTRSGHIGIFKRTGEFGRNKVPTHEKMTELRTTSIPQMLNNRDVKSKIQKRAVRRFNNTLDHEINRTLEKGGK